MTVRTVRLLDRTPGQPSDDHARILFGVTLNRCGPPPPKKQQRHPIRAAMELMEVGESFLHSHRCKDVCNALRASGKDFTSRRQPNGQYRIWRIA